VNDILNDRQKLDSLSGIIAWMFSVIAGSHMNFTVWPEFAAEKRDREVGARRGRRVGENRILCTCCAVNRDRFIRDVR
jgi:hypothetical protein